MTKLKFVAKSVTKIWHLLRRNWNLSLKMLLLIYLVQFFKSNPNIYLSLSLSLSLPFTTAVHCIVKLPSPLFTAPSSSHHRCSLCHPSLFLFLFESKHAAATERGPRCRLNRTMPLLIVWVLQGRSPLPQATLFGFPTMLLLIAISPLVLSLFHNSLFDPLFGFQENRRKIRIIFFVSNLFAKKCLSHLDLRICWKYKFSISNLFAECLHIWESAGN